MKHQIERTITSEHQLLVNGQMFVEKKTSKELHGMVVTIHSRQIDGVYLKLSQTKGKDGLLIDESIETSIDTRNCCRGKCNNQSHKNINTIFKFNSEWESGWNPKKNTSRIFSCLK